MQKAKYYEHSSLWMVEILKSLGSFLKNQLEEHEPTHLMALESKGATLADLLLADYIHTEIPTIYSRALDFLPEEEMRRAKIMVLDDCFHSGSTLRKAVESVNESGAHAVPVGFFDYSSGEPDDGYDRDLYEATSFPEADHVSRTVPRRELQQFLQTVLVATRLPSSFGHLTFTAPCDGAQWARFVDELFETNRFVYYGTRGPSLCGSLILDDILPDQEWSVPPKVRFWFDRDSNRQPALTISPMAFPQGGLTTRDEHVRSTDEALRELVRSRSPDADKRDRYDAASFATRLACLRAVKQTLTNVGLRPVLDSKNFQRSFPTVHSELESLISSEYDNLSHHTMVAPTYGAPEPISFLPLSKQLKLDLREIYDSQPGPKKDKPSSGLTVSNILQRYGDHHPFTVHAAIDYCADFDYVAAFSLPDETRALRATELDTKYTAEVLAAYVVYSAAARDGRCPVWKLTKTFSVLGQAAEIPSLDSIIATTRKGPFGGMSMLLGFDGRIDTKGQSSDDLIGWEDFASDFWRTEGDGTEKKCLPTEDEQQVFEAILKDRRIDGYETALDACQFLFEVGGYPAGVLLSILPDQLGGTSYIAHGIDQLLQRTWTGLAGNVEDKRDDIERYCDGLEYKFDVLSDEATHQLDDTVLNGLERRASTLHRTRSTMAQAQAILGKAHPLRPVDQRVGQKLNPIYEALRQLADTSIQLSSAVVASSDESRIRAAAGALPCRSRRRTSRHGSIAVDVRYSHDETRCWLRALSASQDVSDVGLRSASDTESYPFHVAYDLRAERRAGVEKGNVPALDLHVHRTMANWFHAFGGAVNCVGPGDDLRYSVYPTPEAAFGAACWSMYFSQELSGIHPYYSGNPTLGMAIASGQSTVTDGVLAGGSETMSRIGHFLKGKDVADDIVGKVTTDPLCVVDPDTITDATKGLGDYIGEVTLRDDVQTTPELDEYLHGLKAVDFRRYVLDHPYPWEILEE